MAYAAAVDGQSLTILALAALGTAVIVAITAIVQRHRQRRDGATPGPDVTGRGGPAQGRPTHGRPAQGDAPHGTAPRDGTDGAAGRGRTRPRGDVTTPPMVLDIVRWFRPRGFFADVTGTDEQVAAILADRVIDEWGVPLEQLADDQQAADMHVLSFDERRVYRPGSKYIDRGDGTYAEVVRRAAALAPATFPVRDIVERWDGDDGPIHVTYRLYGAEHRFTTAADRYLDASIVLHLDLAADDPEVRLRVCDHLGMPDFVVAFDDATADALHRDRGWTFWDDVATAG
jgi:hypothetical protein